MLNSTSIFQNDFPMRRLGILLLFAFIVSACGQKGALYLPKEKDKPEMTEEGTVKERNGK